MLLQENFEIMTSETASGGLYKAMVLLSLLGQAEVSPTQVMSIEIFPFISSEARSLLGFYWALYGFLWASKSSFLLATVS